MKIFGVVVVLDEHAVALAVLDLEAEERGHVGDACGLLHVVRDDHDRVVVLQLVHQLLDPRVAIGSSAEAGSSISSTSGSIGERARDAEPLLLAAGEAERAAASGGP